MVSIDKEDKRGEKTRVMMPIELGARNMLQDVKVRNRLRNASEAVYLLADKSGEKAAVERMRKLMD